MKNKDLILKEILNTRLEEVELLISDNSTSTSSMVSEENEIQEEYLRKFMVSIIPRVSKNAINERIKKDFFDLLNSLYSSAFSNDFRFFDAFNYGFEVLKSLDEDISNFNVQEYLKNYKTLLSHHINLLNN